jgi:hypothetical protein
MNVKKYFIVVFVITVTFLYTGCDGNGFQSVDCDECYTPEPDSADLYVRVTINKENPAVPLEIYKGKVEENVLEWIDTTSSSSYYLYVKTNEYYSVIAKYKSGTRTIFAIDGEKIKTQKVSDVCDNDCWIIKGGKLDVSLKY